ncbi:hypothetical protein BOTBODRAFT_133413 [Botryobasidium botryosum FD-172 SS1]|uniref:mRNA export factor MEX67 n=1 Tax=Botryobasidium botryosum (strain FD-172 SS1) TaxID=930990 RepID=A0A067MCM6_BOTB1|nr:hypothetical protein BOTBODRAFT_133413 [Botryobasidium botryosum FD-172 SS1]
MFSSPTPAPGGSSRRPIVSSALRSAGLIDGDVRMAGEDDQSRRKDKRHRVYERPRPAEKDPHGPSSSRRPNLLLSRLSRPAVGHSIRGVASGSSTSHAAQSLSAAGRPRRNAVSTDADARTRGKSVEILRQFVNSRWNPETKFLDLSRMKEDALLTANKIVAPGLPGASRDIGAVILKIASQLKPEVQTISFAHNNFSSTQPISTLHHYLPRLENITLEGNHIRAMKDLDYLTPRSKLKVSQIKEVILLGTPLRDNDYSHGRQDKYKTEVARRFPMLSMLDHEPVAKIGFDIAVADSSAAPVPSSSQLSMTFPFEMRPNLIAVGCEDQTIQFLSRFISEWDTSRASLRAVYAPAATFSWSANTSIPPRARVRGYHTSKDMPNQRRLDWTPWLSGSRNLQRVVTNLDKTTASLHTGPDEIMDFFSRLPRTAHELSDNAKIVVDAWPVAGLLPGEGDAGTALFVTVHGQFAEEPSNGVRSFDRSFVLGVAPTGSPAQLAGWQYTVLSDQLSIRGYSNHDAWAPGPLKIVGSGPDVPMSAPPLAQPIPIPAPAPVAPVVPVAPAPAATPQEAAIMKNPELASLVEPQRSAVIHISQQTGMNVSYSFMCLRDNSWDVNAALLNFGQLKAGGTLPAEAFVH